MKYSKHQINYIKDKASHSLNGILKGDVIQFLLDNNIEVKKNIAKVKAINMILDNDVLTEKFIDMYKDNINVPYYDVATTYCLTYFQVSELDHLGIIEALEYKDKKGATLYPFSVLGYEDNYLLDEYEKRYKTDFHRTRIEFDSNDNSVNDFIDKLSATFDIENMSKLYPKQDSKGYNLYLSLRPKTNTMNNDDILIKQNVNLKTNLSIAKGQIAELEQKLQNKCSEIKNTPEYKELQANYMECKRECNRLKIDAGMYYDIKDSYNKLQEKYNNLQENQSKGGRPNKLSVQDIETMKLYRIQGKSYRQLAELFNCSIGLVSNTLKNFECKK